MTKKFHVITPAALLILAGCAGHSTHHTVAFYPPLNGNPAPVASVKGATRNPAQTTVTSSPDLFYFNTPNDVRGADAPKELVDWITAIGQAKKSIVMEMFHITNDDIKTALINATAPSITLILDAANLKSDREAAAKKPVDPATGAPTLCVVDQIKKAHPSIQIFPSSDQFSETHTKAMVVDDEVALITSINLTNNAAFQRDYGVRTSDPAIIQEMNDVFAADVTNSQNNPNTKITPTTAGKSNGPLIWSPLVDDAASDQLSTETRLVNLIKSAEKIPDANPDQNPPVNLKFINVTVENLGDNAIEAALAEAAANGVNVRLIVPQCVMGLGSRNYQFFSKLGTVAIKVMPNPYTPITPYMHGKMIALGNGDGYIGSVNYSANSTHNNRELGIIFSNSDVAGQLSADFETDWNNAVAYDPKAAIPHCSDDPVAPTDPTVNPPTVAPATAVGTDVTPDKVQPRRMHQHQHQSQVQRPQKTQSQPQQQQPQQPPNQDQSSP